MERSEKKARTRGPRRGSRRWLPHLVLPVGSARDFGCFVGTFFHSLPVAEGVKVKLTRLRYKYPVFVSVLSLPHS